MDVAFEEPYPLAILTAIDISGLSAGAYPANSEWSGLSAASCAVPVFPAIFSLRSFKTALFFTNCSMPECTVSHT